MCYESSMHDTGQRWPMRDHLHILFYEWGVSAVEMGHSVFSQLSIRRDLYKEVTWQTLFHSARDMICKHGCLRTWAVLRYFIETCHMRQYAIIITTYNNSEYTGDITSLVKHVTWDSMVSRQGTYSASPVVQWNMTWDSLLSLQLINNSEYTDFTGDIQY